MTAYYNQIAKGICTAFIRLQSINDLPAVSNLAMQKQNNTHCITPKTGIISFIKAIRVRTMSTVKNLVVTLDIDFDVNITRYTRQPLIDYAKRIGASFAVINQRKINFSYLNMEKFQIGDFYRRFDNILYVDADVLISPKSPSIFEGREEADVWMYDEGWGFAENERDRDRLVELYLPRVRHWPRNKEGRYVYYNSGVMLLNNKASNMFNDRDWGEYVRNLFRDQTHINYLIHKHSLRSSNLGSVWNKMECDQREIKIRTDAYFVHYAGAGTNKLEILKDDYAFLFGHYA